MGGGKGWPDCTLATAIAPRPEGRRTSIPDREAFSRPGVRCSVFSRFCCLTLCLSCPLLLLPFHSVSLFCFLSRATCPSITSDGVDRGEPELRAFGNSPDNEHTMLGDGRLLVRKCGDTSTNALLNARSGRHRRKGVGVPVRPPSRRAARMRVAPCPEGLPKWWPREGPSQRSHCGKCCCTPQPDHCDNEPPALLRRHRTTAGRQPRARNREETLTITMIGGESPRPGPRDCVLRPPIPLKRLTLSAARGSGRARAD